MVREYEDLALRLLLRDPRHSRVEPRDVGAVRDNERVGREAVDAPEVCQCPREDVELLWVERGPERAAEDRERRGEVVPCLLKEDEAAVGRGLEGAEAGVGVCLRYLLD